MKAAAPEVAKAAGKEAEGMDTTRSDHEVQNGVADEFADRLANVWKEARRVLEDNGLLIFTYHHSRPEGWRCVLGGLMDAGFGITATHPIKAEMSVAMPKLQAKEPIDLDIIVVCRKRSQLASKAWNGDLESTVAPNAMQQARRLVDAGRRLSRNDVRVIVMAQLLRQLSVSQSAGRAMDFLDGANDAIESLIDQLRPLHRISSRRYSGE